ncbi:nitrogen fixation negative regulator NifL [Marinospirillum sp.]|uniref:nitrogen fixation negative regulator NifL n=1 Tax=Marinospirillum sp. TaxID=2183934 RepID=UPI00286FFC10|nr:nitrogen fixation negative regulator NifL [Marinospirillum sp.]MDR9467942.1 nitrogen fixation negative regulator NifL [Marinospirillum sp.]
MCESKDLSTALSFKAAFEQLPPEVFRLAVEQAAVAISITDTRARIVYSNPSFSRVTGYSQQELLGKNQSILSYKVTPKIVYESLWGQLQRKQPWSGLLVNRRKDGSRYLADLTITPVLNAQGETTHYLGMQRDVTEMHQLEHQVMNQQALIERALDSTQAAMVMVQADLQPVMSNRSYKELEKHLGYPPLPELCQALKAQWPNLFQDDVLLNRSFAPLEVRLSGHHDPELWFSCSGEVIEEKDTSADAFYQKSFTRYLLLTLQDISHLKQQQKQLQLTSLQALLSEQERLQSVRETLSGAIYQLERPLNLINAAARLVSRREQPGSEELLSLLGEVQAAGQETVNQLTRCLPSDIREEDQVVNLNQLLQSSLSLLTPRLLAAGVIVDWQPESDLPRIQAKPTSLATLFKQLLDNALDAMQASRSDQRELQITTRSYKEFVEVTLQDSGPGIPPSDQLRVFEPFFTTRQQSDKHLGMGLTLAQEIVNSHQGLLEVDPEFTSGCRIKVQLPYV